MTEPTEREMVADMMTAVLGELETIVLVHRDAAESAVVAICKMLEVSPATWRRVLAEKLRDFEAGGLARTPDQYRMLVRHALQPPRREHGS